MTQRLYPSGNAKYPPPHRPSYGMGFQRVQPEHELVAKSNARILRNHMTAFCDLMRIDHSDLSTSAVRSVGMTTARWHVIRIGYQLGMSINGISVAMGIDRDSVRHAIRSDFKPSERKSRSINSGGLPRPAPKPGGRFNQSGIGR